MNMVLPQGSFATDSASSSTPVLLVAGGRAPTKDWLKQVSHNCPVWAVDRGIDACRAAAVIPEVLIGDADSAAAESWEWANSLHIPIVRHCTDKDFTDLQLTLQELGRRRPGSLVLLTGGMGRRFDHAFSNVFSLLESNSADIKTIGLADEAEALFFVEAGQLFQADLLESPTAVSLLPLSVVCEKVQSRGVHWPLTNATLTMDHPGGICNRLAAGSHRVNVSLEKGRLGVYFCWDESGL